MLSGVLIGQETCASEEEGEEDVAGEEVDAPIPAGDASVCGVRLAWAGLSPVAEVLVEACSWTAGC